VPSRKEVNMGTSRIAIFGTGGNVGKGLIPLLINAGYDNVEVVTHKDETKTLWKNQDVIVRGDYYLEKEAVILSLKGCSKVMLALPRTLKRSEVIDYGKFIGDCAEAASVPILIRLAVSEYDIRPFSARAEDGFRILDAYLAKLTIEVVTIQSESMGSGRWEDSKVKKKKKQLNVRAKRDKENVTNVKRLEDPADNFIGWSVMVDNASEAASDKNNQEVPDSTQNSESSGLWNYVSSSWRAVIPPKDTADPR
jgi:hypothetical protein